MRITKCSWLYFLTNDSDIFLSKERVNWFHGIWDFFFYVRIISRLLWNGPWSFLPQMSTLHTRSFWHSTYIKCNCNSIFLFFLFFGVLVFSNMWLYFHLPWLLVLCLWITLQQVYTSCPNNYLLEKYWIEFEGCFFSFCEICKEFVLQCTKMNKHWKFMFCYLLLFFSQKNKNCTIWDLEVKVGK